MIVHDDLIAEDLCFPADKRTITEVAKMGSSIHVMIQLTSDCPSENQSSKMPVLDLACWISEEDGTLNWTHYRKPMANFNVMMEFSAMPLKVKRTSLTQEVIRILRNCRKELPWEEKAEHLSDLAARMKASGYSEKFRCEIINAGLRGYEKMSQIEESGGRPINRLRSDNASERKQEKLRNKITWHKKGGYNVPIFIPYTPKGELARIVRDISERDKSRKYVRFRVVEESGISFKNLLQKSDPWSKSKCTRADCFPCTTTDKGGNCSKSNVTYQIVCLRCQDQGIVSHYKGETSRNMYSRGVEHLRDLKGKSDDSPLWMHCVEHHESEIVSFKMELTGTFQKPLARQVMEGIQIHSFSGVAINRKQEYRQPAVARTQFTRSIRD